MDVNDFDCYLEYEYRKPKDLALIGQKVHQLRNHWCPQMNGKDLTFYTLGASLYTHISDNNGENIYLSLKKYYEEAQRLKKVLIKEFGHLYDELLVFLQEKLEAEVSLTEKYGVPGFHIFHKPIEGHRHADGHAALLFDSEEYDFSQIISILLPIEIPSAGAALSFWRDRSTFEPLNDADIVLNFELGKIYFFDGLYVHQIKSFPMKSGEKRITLQGHAVKNKKGFWSVIW